MSISLEFEVYEVDGRKVWPHFAAHHYLDEKYSGHRAWLFVLRHTGTAVAFVSAKAQPSGHYKNGWREHRTVVLPDYQGLGLGPRISELVGEILISEGKRWYSRTAHPRMGEFRENSPYWEGTSHNKKAHKPIELERHTKPGFGRLRVSYGHRYMGRDGHGGDLAPDEQT